MQDRDKMNDELTWGDLAELRRIGGRLLTGRPGQLTAGASTLGAFSQCGLILPACCLSLQCSEFERDRILRYMVAECELGDTSCAILMNAHQHFSERKGPYAPRRGPASRSIGKTS